MELTIAWCLSHGSGLSPQSSDPQDVCLAYLVDKHDRIGACAIEMVRLVGFDVKAWDVERTPSPGRFTRSIGGGEG